MKMEQKKFEIISCSANLVVSIKLKSFFKEIPFFLGGGAIPKIIKTVAVTINIV